ncbi:MEDS domain-containing protein [Streptomyces sp. LP05-1]|uniref:MEDS domain-containing protein n=1 Tax=Streptomyces pyxinae TaxID=2970734 RepID=A0ABT2CBY2_9ACTN|nr:MEDS domain-containing protein [Streptomyces sp. LP05-1]MCS0634830.1 MEDS domain-containing protein [Streptomyces sp. LP05-1]
MHTSVVYATDDAWATRVSACVRRGIERDERLLYFAHRTPPETVFATLADRGIDVAAARRRGQLSVRTAQESYLAELPFDPDTVIRQWHTATREALEAGFTGLRAMGEMDWYGAGVPGAERLLEYELRMHREAFDLLPLAAMCLYDRRLLPDRDVALLEAAHLSRIREPGERLHPPVLAVTPLADRPGLGLTGELNADSRAALAGALATLRHGSDGDEVDLTSLVHIDAAATAGLAAVALRTPARRLTVRGAPPSLLRTIDLFPELGAALEVPSR